MAHRVRSVHAAIETMLRVLHLYDLSLLRTLLLALANNDAYYNAKDAAKAGNPNHHTEETTGAFSDASQDFRTRRAGWLLRVSTGRH